MTARKIKHERAMAKRKIFMDQYKTEGQLALKRQRDRKAREEWEAWRDNHDKKHGALGWAVKECPLCKKGIQNSRGT